MKKLIVSIFLWVVCSGCAIFEVTQEHYRKDFGRIPQEGTMSVESSASLSRAATEVNKGLGKVKGLFDHADVIAPEHFVKKAMEMYDQIKADYDFSFILTDFLGSMLSEIDWDDPDAYFEQLKSEKEAYKKVQIEKRELEAEFDQAQKDFQQNLMQKDKVIQDKDGEMQARDGKWSMRMATWVKAVWWLAIVAGLFLFGPLLLAIIKAKLAGATWRAAIGGARIIKKSADQTYKGLQAFRERLKQNIEAGEHSESARMFLDDLNTKMENFQDDDVKVFIKSRKEKMK